MTASWKRIHHDIILLVRKRGTTNKKQYRHTKTRTKMWKTNAQRGCNLHLRAITTKTVLHKLQIGKLRVDSSIKDGGNVGVRNGGQKYGFMRNIVWLLKRQFFRIADGKKWRVSAHDWDSELANTALHRFGDSSPDGGDNFKKIARAYPCTEGEARWKRTLGGFCKRDAKVAESMKTWWI